MPGTAVAEVFEHLRVLQNQSWFVFDSPSSSLLQCMGERGLEPREVKGGLVRMKTETEYRPEAVHLAKMEDGPEVVDFPNTDSDD